MKGSGCLTVILAADAETMVSKLPVALHKVCGRPIIDYVVEAAEAVSEYSPVVISSGADGVRDYLGDRVRCVRQHSLGTGHALMNALEFIKEGPASVLVLAGNTPQITANTLKELKELRAEKGHAAAVLSADDKGSADFAALYCFLADDLLKGLKEMAAQVGTNAWDLSEVYALLKAQGRSVEEFVLSDAAELSLIQNRIQLAEAETRMRRLINETHMKAGVTLIDPERTYIGPHVQIGRDCVIYPDNYLEGSTILGEDCILYPGSRVADAVLGTGVKIQASVILNSSIGHNTTVGPYAYIRPGSTIGDGVRIGDFVEVKNAMVGSGTKISHLTYIGDADLGRDINVGCGVVCVNYDGRRKHRTTIGDGVFIGCNVNLVAPLEVEPGAYIAAGSTITEKVPSRALAIARARQVNKIGWKDKRLEDD